ncbi:MAG: periplasmic heavy metal sensor [Myxococcales bacterium]
MNPPIKKLVWALAVSLGLNLFLLGFGAARWFGPKGPPPGQLAHGGMGPGKGMHMFGSHAPELRAQRREVLEAREAVAAALTREPFDKQALVDALSNLRNVTAAGQLKLHQVLVDTADKMPADERARLAHSRLLHDVPGKR